MYIYIVTLEHVGKYDYETVVSIVRKDWLYSMKRVKYTNTGVIPLSVIRTSDKGHYIFDDTKNGVLSIYIIRVRNHSKNESAKCKLYFEDKTIIVERSKEAILTQISNIYLSDMLLFTNRRDLFDKLFLGKSTKNYMSGSFLLEEYIRKCVLIKLRKEGVLDEN